MWAIFCRPIQTRPARGSEDLSCEVGRAESASNEPAEALPGLPVENRSQQGARSWEASIVTEFRDRRSYRGSLDKPIRQGDSCGQIESIELAKRD
jgi:hypothetical protein